MSKLLMHDTSTASWQALVVDATERASCNLEEELESYLVFTLSRFCQQPELIPDIFAFNFMHAVQSQNGDALRDVGDKCLLFSGLFPEQAEKRLVSLKYFIDMGRCAYDEAATQVRQGYSQLYQNLSDAFIRLLEVLLALRSLGQAIPIYEPLMAMELLQHTHSKVAKESLSAYTQTSPLILKQ